MTLQPINLALALILSTTVVSAEPATVPAAVTSTSPVTASMPTQPALTATITARVQARWAALIKRDFATAYTFETPAFRQLHPAEQFGRRYGGAVKWTGIEVTSVTPSVDAQAAQVALMLSYETVLPDGGTLYKGRRRMDETWIQVAGQWWVAH